MPSACCACSAAQRRSHAEAGGTRTLIRPEQAPYLRSQQISPDTPASPSDRPQVIGPKRSAPAVVFVRSPFLSGAMDPSYVVSSRRRRLVRRQLRRAHAGAGGGWPAIKAGRHVLIAAPTGSGKTLAAFLAAIDDLVRQGLDGGLHDETQVVYVSPLKALSNDIQRNLERRSPASARSLREQGLPDVEIRTGVRTGDTPPASATACAAGRRTSSSPRRSRSTSCSARSRAARCSRPRAR